MRLFVHLNVALSIALALAVPAPVSPAQQSGYTSDFTVLSRGVSIGTESVTVTPSSDGWLISAIGSLGPPIDLTTTKFQLRYTKEWQPVSLAVEGVQGGQLLMLNSSFTPGEARNEALQRGQKTNATHAISPQTIVLPNGFYAPYEALAARIGSASVGSSFKVYVAPQGEIAATVTRITPHRLVTPTGRLELRQFDLLFSNPRAPLSAEVWIDGNNRLARVAIPASLLTVMRSDISSVMTREETITRPGDQEVFMPANGFTVGGTMSAPQGAPGRGPAIVLVGGAGREDREQRTAGVPVFGQLAGALADAGFLVVRYDKRGVGRSGGRVESATIEDYADDALSVVAWLKKRPDVDPNRVAIAGYAEGAAVALIAGAREKRIAALCLVAAPGQTGREVTLLQQEHALAQSKEPEESKRAKADLERKVLDAVTKGSGWDGVPPAIQYQADTAWFKSWLVFDPAKVMTKVRQPILILTGAVDRQFPTDQADRLETLARARKKLTPEATRKVVVPGINHLLVTAASGEEDEYHTLVGATVSPAVGTAIADWLKAAMPQKKK